MVSTQLGESITEVLDIINHMEKIYTDKIPRRFQTFLEKNKSNTYKSNLNHSQPLNEMNLKKDTKNILGIIYCNYWCDKNQKEQFLKKIKNN